MPIDVHSNPGTVRLAAPDGPKDRLRVLLLDDAPASVELVARALREAGIEFLIKRVQTRETFIQEIARSPPDVVLLESKLRQWDGASALQCLHERLPHIPAVFVTESLGDEAAVALMKAGAADYVLKEHPARLATAIRSAVERARAVIERRKAEQALAHSEERFRRLIEDASDAIAIIGADGCIRYMSPAIRAIAGHEPAEIVGKRLLEFIHADDVSKVEHCLDLLRREPDNPRRSTVRFLHKSGKWRAIEGACRNLLGSPQIDGIVLTIRDVSERERHVRALAALGAANAALVHADGESGVLGEICNVLVRIGGYRLAWIGLAQPDVHRSVMPVACAGTDESYLANLKVEWSEGERGKGPTGTAIRTGRPQIAQHIATDPRFEPWRLDAIEHGFASSIALPLPDAGKPLGALNIYSTEPDAFDAEEVALLEQLAADVAYGLRALRARHSGHDP